MSETPVVDVQVSYKLERTFKTDKITGHKTPQDTGIVTYNISTEFTSISHSERISAFGSVSDARKKSDSAFRQWSERFKQHFKRGLVAVSTIAMQGDRTTVNFESQVSTIPNFSIVVRNIDSFIMAEQSANDLLDGLLWNLETVNLDS